ncbi:MAG: class I SAM-dependent methyltransferase [Bryobacterales bacterium]|nr:class I SAM-dependent methyltransferase [Bryobacterales bacterium]
MNNFTALEKRRIGRTVETGWPNLKNRRTDNPCDLQAVMMLRRASYEHAGLSLPLEDNFDHAENTRLYLTLEGETPIATVRTSLIGPGCKEHRSPFGERYRDLYTNRIGTDGYVEVTRLAVVNAGISVQARRLYAVLQNPTTLADAHDCGYIVAPTRSDHKVLPRNGLSFNHWRGALLKLASRNRRTDPGLESESAGTENSQTVPVHLRAGFRNGARSMTTRKVNWTAYAKAYDCMATHNPAYQEIVHTCRAVARLWDLHPGSQILDLGAGTGNFSVELARQFPHVTVVHVDSSAGMCAVASKKKEHFHLQNLRIVHADATAIQFEENTFAAIISVHNLYTLPSPTSMIDDMFRWLRPGGHLFACDAGRPVDVKDWTRYILGETRRREGLRAMLKVLWDARAAITENRKIRNMQEHQTYWLHDLGEFHSAFASAGFEIDKSFTMYRGCSDVVLARVPARKRSMDPMLNRAGVVR